MDDVSSNESISELFAHKYNVLYNSVCSNTTQLNELLALNENDIIANCSNNNTSLINKNTHHVSVDQLQNAIHKIKSSKSDCTDQLFSDHFINGTLRFCTLISLLFTSMLSHGVALQDYYCLLWHLCPKTNGVVRVIQTIIELLLLVVF